MDLEIRLRSVGSLTRFVSENRSRRFRNSFRVRIRTWPNNGQVEGTPMTIVNPDFSGSILRVPLPTVDPGAVVGIAIQIVPRTSRGADQPFISTGRIEIVNTDGTTRVNPTGQDELSNLNRLNLYYVSDWANALTTFRNDQVTAGEKDFRLLGLAYGFPDFPRFEKRMWEEFGNDLPAIIDQIDDDDSWTNIDGALADKWETATYSVDLRSTQAGYNVRLLKSNGSLYGTGSFGMRLEREGFPVRVPLRWVELDVSRPAGARIRRERKDRLRDALIQFVQNTASDLGSDHRPPFDVAAAAISAERAQRGFADSYRTVLFSNFSTTVVPSWQEGRSTTPIAAYRPVYRGGFATVEPRTLTATMSSGPFRV